MGTKRLAMGITWLKAFFSQPLSSFAPSKFETTDASTDEHYLSRFRRDYPKEIGNCRNIYHIKIVPFSISNINKLINSIMYSDYTVFETIDKSNDFSEPDLSIFKFEFESVNVYYATSYNDHNINTEIHLFFLQFKHFQMEERT